MDGFFGEPNSGIVPPLGDQRIGVKCPRRRDEGESEKVAETAMDQTVAKHDVPILPRLETPRDALDALGFYCGVGNCWGALSTLNGICFMEVLLTTTSI